MPGPSDIEVKNNPAQSRYEISVAGDLAGVANYILEPNRVVFVHTQIGRARRGAGLGATLVETALADVRARGLHVEARCDFVADYLRNHPEHGDPLALDTAPVLPPAA